MADPTPDRASRWRTLSWWLAAATLLVPPLVVVGGLQESFRLPKLLTSETLVLLSLLALVPVAARSGVSLREGAWRSVAARAALPLVIVAFLGLPFTAHPEHVHEALWSLAIGAAALVGWSLGLRHLDRLLLLVLPPAVVAAGIAFLQRRTLESSMDAREARLETTSLIGAVGDVAAYLVLPILLVQAVLLVAWRLRRRDDGSRSQRSRRQQTANRLAVAGAVLLVVMVVGLVVLETWTALVAVAAGSVVLWAVILPRRVTLALVASGAVVATLLLLGPLAGRAERQLQAFEGGGLNGLLSGRLDGWSAALWMAGEQPLTGVGHGAYVAAFGDAKLALAAAGWQPYERHIYPYFGNAHNDFLEVVAELGLPGALALVWALAWIGIRLRRRWAAVPPSSDPELVGKAAWQLDLGGVGTATAVAAVVALAVLATAYFPLRLAITGYPAVVLLAWIFSDGFVPSPEGSS